MSRLNGKVVATLEARRASEMAGLISRHGGVPYSAPAMREVPLDNRGEVAAFVDRLIAGPLDVLICLTGGGTRALLEAADGMGRLPEVIGALSKIIVVARGPKPVAVLRQYGVRIDYVPPEPNTSQELLEMIRPLELSGKVVAMQHYGEPNVFLREALLSLGAHVFEVSLYQWALPEDKEPLVRFLADIQSGGIDVVAATSKTQIHNLFAVAKSLGKVESLRDSLNTSVSVAAVGPVAAQAWRDWGVSVDIIPVHPKMGHLVLAIAEHFQSKHPEEVKAAVV
ncbi:MAG: Uroporphyrinogen synthase, uroporhyrinogen decarboxylase [Dehalococcoidia bacterium]|nr:Uroporphyrinogen synthase, uroporhyrinogen decarboxylase [Dehalococcoidia bacterium]